MYCPNRQRNNLPRFLDKAPYAFEHALSSACILDKCAHSGSRQAWAVDQIQIEEISSQDKQEKSTPKPTRLDSFFVLYIG